jgi:hypothetical protein
MRLAERRSNGSASVRNPAHHEKAKLFSDVYLVSPLCRPFVYSALDRVSKVSQGGGSRIFEEIKGLPVTAWKKDKQSNLTVALQDINNLIVLH